MIEQSLKSKIKKVKVDNIEIVYNLVFKDAFYSLKCYAEGSEILDNCCYIENLTDDEGQAEDFVDQLAKGKVLPIHITDLAQDYFG